MGGAQEPHSLKGPFASLRCAILYSGAVKVKKYTKMNGLKKYTKMGPVVAGKKR